MTLAIDPGKETGLAFFRGTELVGVSLVDGDDPPPLFGVDAVVCEIPHTGDGRATKADIITLSVRAGRVMGRVPRGASSRLVTPSDWKGQLPKAVSHARIAGALTELEQGVLAAVCEPLPKGSRHNVWDAVGIGLWALGR